MRYMLFVIITFLLFAIPANVSSDEKSESASPEWHMKGNLVITDTCGVNCPCLYGFDPHHNSCRFLGGMKINEGNYGVVSLNGVTWGMLGEFTGSRENQKFLYMAYYIDNKASKKQQEAVRSILSGAPFSGLGEQLGIKVIPVRVVVPDSSLGEYKLSLGKLGTMSVMPAVGNDKSTPLKIENPVYPFPISEVIIGHAKGEFNDHGKDMELTDNSGEISIVELAGGGSSS